MKILIIADFQDDSPRTMWNNARIFAKGFTRNGHDVLPFSYRTRMLQLSPIPSKRWAPRLAKKKTDRLLTHMAQHHQPDLILVTAFKLLDAQTILMLKNTLPHAVFCAWYGDMYHGVDPKVVPIARLCDWFLATSAGLLLRDYHGLGILHCAFMPNPCDPDLQPPRTIPPQFHSTVLFTGKLRHGQAGQDNLRTQLITHLAQKQNLTVYGDLGRPPVRGRDYLHAICGTKIALSINAFNDIPRYHSDRLTHYLASGAFVLAKSVPQSELLFENQKHLCYFDSQSQCLELIERFLADEPARRKIAAAGRQRVHDAFSGPKLARYIVDLVTQGDFQETWKEII